MSNYYDAVMGKAESRRGLHDRAKDMRDTLAYINGARSMFGFPLLESLPTAITGNATECLYARGFGDMAHVSVGGSGEMTFENSPMGRALASYVGRLPGANRIGELEVSAPPMFGRVIAAFDGGDFPEFDPTGSDD